MRAGQELDPALALHFGEAFEITELSIVGLMGQACETVATHSRSWAATTG
jgi:hypothetical protein